jgi:hypothetical protein
MTPEFEKSLHLTRRQFFGRAACGIGTAALAAMLQEEGAAATDASKPEGGGAHFPGKAKRMVVLWQGGGPSHVDLWDYKPGLEAMRGQEIPDSIRSKGRLSTMTAGYKSFPVLPPQKPFQQYGKSGMWLSPLVPHIGSIADDICVINSMHTEAVNHAPGVTFFMTGSQVPGRPSFGAWATYGLGSVAKDLPGFCVMTSTDVGRTCGQLFYDYYWGSGFLPSKYQGVRFRSEGEPVLYLKNPDGMPANLRRGVLDDIAELNRKRLADFGDPEIDTRITQYELAYRMQTSVPELLDISKEPSAILEMYGPDVQRPGSFARNCLLTRRLLERGVRFVQCMHSGWDQHSNWSYQLANQCKDTDQPAAALVKDLKQRGMLDDTIVMWGAEFGRTPFVQGDLTKPSGHGRDHLGSVYSVWIAGGGFKGGVKYGESDEYAYNVAKDGVHVHDLQATLLNQLGFDHTRLTYRYQGRDFRLTDVYGNVVKDLLA